MSQMKDGHAARARRRSGTSARRPRVAPNGADPRFNAPAAAQSKSTALPSRLKSGCSMVGHPARHGPIGCCPRSAVCGVRRRFADRGRAEPGTGRRVRGSAASGRGLELSDACGVGSLPGRANDGCRRSLGAAATVTASNGTPLPPAPNEAELAALLAEIENLSDDEAAKLLADEGAANGRNRSIGVCADVRFLARGAKPCFSRAPDGFCIRAFIIIVLSSCLTSSWKCSASTGGPTRRVRNPSILHVRFATGTRQFVSATRGRARNTRQYLMQLIHESAQLHVECVSVFKEEWHEGRTNVADRGANFSKNFWPLANPGNLARRSERRFEETRRGRRLAHDRRIRRVDQSVAQASRQIIVVLELCCSEPVRGRSQRIQSNLAAVRGKVVGAASKSVSICQLTTWMGWGLRTRYSEETL